MTGASLSRSSLRLNMQATIQAMKCLVIRPIMHHTSFNMKIHMHSHSHQDEQIISIYIDRKLGVQQHRQHMEQEVEALHKALE